MPCNASGSDSSGGNALPIAPGITSSPKLFKINSWQMPIVWFSASTTLTVFTRGRASPVPTSQEVVAVTGAIRSNHFMQEAMSTCPAWRMRSTPSNAWTTWDGGSAPMDGMWVSAIRPIFIPTLSLFSSGQSARRAKAQQRPRGPTRNGTLLVRRAGDRCPDRRCERTDQPENGPSRQTACALAPKIYSYAVTIPCLLLPRGEAVGATADDEPQLFGPSDHFYSDTAGWVAEFHGAVDVKADEKSQLSSSSRLPSANMASIEATSVMRSEIFR